MPIWGTLGTMNVLLFEDGAPPVASVEAEGEHRHLQRELGEQRMETVCGAGYRLVA